MLNKKRQHIKNNEHVIFFPVIISEIHLKTISRKVVDKTINPTLEFHLLSASPSQTPQPFPDVTIVWSQISSQRITVERLLMNR